ncbi:MAG: zinc-binding dehydrogenase [Clostridia bacterium]|nr:zinc-binding dehydrogenase [Clostridia bacterium]
MKGFGVYSLHNAGPMEKPDYKIVNPTDVIVKTTCVAPCTSDTHLIHNNFVPGIFGHFIGHEAVGVVCEVGPAVKDFKVGDRVTCPGNGPNFGSLLGQAGVWAHAPGSSRSQDPDCEGMFAEYQYFKNGDMYLAHIPDNVTDAQAVMVSDMMGTAFTGLNQMDIRFGESVAVIGIGPVGLMGIAGAVHKGAGNVIGVGHRAACKKLAYEYGATTVVDYKETDLISGILAANGGKPVDKVLICGGTVQTILDAFRVCRPGGAVVNVAMMLNDDGTLPMVHSLPSYSQDKLYRSCQVIGGRLLNEQMLSLVQYGRIDPGKMVSHEFHGIESIEEAFNVMGNKTEDLVKPVVYID